MQSNRLSVWPPSWRHTFPASTQLLYNPRPMPLRKKQKKTNKKKTNKCNSLFSNLSNKRAILYCKSFLHSCSWLCDEYFIYLYCKSLWVKSSVYCIHLNANRYKKQNTINSFLKQMYDRRPTWQYDYQNISIPYPYDFFKL